MAKSSLRTQFILQTTLAASLFAFLPGVEHAAFAADLAQLDKLAPSGAQREGNQDGSIPAWQGAEPPLPGYEWGKLLCISSKMSLVKSLALPLLALHIW